MKNIEACLTSNSIHWATPTKLYDYFMNLGFVDPCPYGYNGDNLHMDYKDRSLFINPPFKDLKLWIDAILRWVDNGCFIVLLMPVRTDTSYFLKLFNSKHIKSIICINGRLHFNNSKKCAPFPTMLIHITPRQVFSPSFNVCSLDQYIYEGVY